METVIMNKFRYGNAINLSFTPSNTDTSVAKYATDTDTSATTVFVDTDVAAASQTSSTVCNRKFKSKKQLRPASSDKEVKVKRVKQGKKTESRDCTRHRRVQSDRASVAMTTRLPTATSNWNTMCLLHEYLDDDILTLIRPLADF